MQKLKSILVDLSQIRGSGDFPCPKCGVRISPDDHSEKSYTILEPVMKGDLLEKLVIKCNKCESIIALTGFSIPEETN